MKTKQTSYKIPEPICHQVLHVPTIDNLVRSGTMANSDHESRMNPRTKMEGMNIEI